MAIERPRLPDILRLDKGNSNIFKDACGRLYNKIVEDGYKFCYIVDIRRGGVNVSSILCGLFHTKKVTGLSFDSEYSPDGSRKSPVLDQGLSRGVRKKIGDGSILVVDDVCDEGLSLIAAQRYLKKRGISEMRFACPYVKSRRKFEPDYWVEETDKWIVFPGEANETIIKILYPRGIEETDEKVDHLLKYFTMKEIGNAVRTWGVSVKMGLSSY